MEITDAGDVFFGSTKTILLICLLGFLLTLLGSFRIARRLGTLVWCLRKKYSFWKELSNLRYDGITSLSGDILTLTAILNFIGLATICIINLTKGGVFGAILLPLMGIWILCLLYLGLAKS